MHCLLPFLKAIGKSRLESRDWGSGGSGLGSVDREGGGGCESMCWERREYTWVIGGLVGTVVVTV